VDLQLYKFERKHETSKYFILLERIWTS